MNNKQKIINEIKNGDNNGVSDLTELVASMSKEEIKFYAKFLSKNKKFDYQTYTPYKLLLKWIEMVHKCIHTSETVKNLWELGEYELCMTSILMNPKIGKFLAEHISNDTLKSLLLV